MPKKHHLSDTGRQLDLDDYLWRQTRREGVADHRSLLEAARDLDVIATRQHSGENHFYYSTFINLIYKELFHLKKGQIPRGLRNQLTRPQLQKLQIVERQTAQWIRETLAASDDYHQVYYQVQQKVQTLVKELGPEDLAPLNAPTPNSPTSNPPNSPADLQLF
jgi:hypothetical protein